MVCRQPPNCPPNPSGIPLEMLQTLQTMCDTLTQILASQGGTAGGDLFVLGTLYKVQFVPFDFSDVSVQTNGPVSNGKVGNVIAGSRWRVLGFRASAENDINFEVVSAVADNVAAAIATNVSGVAFYSARGGEAVPSTPIGHFAGFGSQGLYIRTDVPGRVSGSLVLVSEEV